MTRVAIIRSLNVTRRFARRSHSIVTTDAVADDLAMIDRSGRQPAHAAVTKLAIVRGV
jgi:hypothetical protein